MALNLSNTSNLEQLALKGLTPFVLAGRDLYRTTRTLSPAQKILDKNLSVYAINVLK